MMRVADLVKVIDAVAPFAAAEPWDRVGLALGDPSAQVEGVYVALDPTLATIARARECGANALVCHHPLLLEAPAAIVAGDPTADRILAAARAEVCIVAAHTNADLVESFATATAVEAFGIVEPKALLGATGMRRFKLVVFVPAAAQDAVAEALSEAGAGIIGDYAECTFRSAGTGTFRALEGASPTIGKVGELEKVEEVRLETLVPASRLGAAVDAMIEAHPYEEVAYDVYPLRADPAGGFGCVGALSPALSLDDVRERCSVLYGNPGWFPAGSGSTRCGLSTGTAGAAGGAETSGSGSGETIHRIAVMPGSASSAARAAADAHADVLVCGEMKYHEALDATEKGVTVLAVGHGASEMPIVRALAQAIRDGVAERGWGVPVVEEGMTTGGQAGGPAEGPTDQPAEEGGIDR